MSLFQHGSGIRTWWSLNITQPGTRFILEVTSNQPITGNDFQDIDAHRVRVRANLGTKGYGRIYRITIRCTDDSGNAVSRIPAVTMPRLLVR